jgi:hypothetical protein
MILAEITLTGTGNPQLIGLPVHNHANQAVALVFQGNVSPVLLLQTDLGPGLEIPADTGVGFVSQTYRLASAPKWVEVVNTETVTISVVEV